MTFPHAGPARRYAKGVVCQSVSRHDRAHSGSRRAAVARLRPRRSSPFRLSYLFGIGSTGRSPPSCCSSPRRLLRSTRPASTRLGFWIGLGLAVVASSGLAILRQRARGTGPALERALDEGLGADWRDGVDAELAARLRRRPSLARILLAPISPAAAASSESRTSATALRAGRTCSTSVAIARIDRAAQYSSTSSRILRQQASWSALPAPSACRRGLDMRRRELPPCLGRRVLRSADRREEGDRLGPRARPRVRRRPERRLRCRKLRWALISRRWPACTAGDSVSQPGFESADTSVAGAISLYGYYGGVALRRATLLTIRVPHEERATVLRRARRSGHARHRRRRTRLRRAATRHIVQPGRLRGAARRATRLRPVPLPSPRHGRRCDRGIHRPHPVSSTGLDRLSARAVRSCPPRSFRTLTSRSCARRASSASSWSL